MRITNEARLAHSRMERATRLETDSLRRQLRGQRPDRRKQKRARRLRRLVWASMMIRLTGHLQGIGRGLERLTPVLGRAVSAFEGLSIGLRDVRLSIDPGRRPGAVIFESPPCRSWSTPERG